MLLVSLHVSAELELTVFAIIQVHADDNGSRTEGVGDATIRWKTIPPKYAGRNHLDDESGGKFLERKRVIHGPHALLHGADVSLYLRDMFVVGGREAVFSAICRSASSPRRGSNCPSINMFVIRNPRIEYTRLTCLIDARTVFIDWFRINSDVANRMLREIVMKKGTVQVGHVARMICTSSTNTFFRIDLLTTHGSFEYGRSMFMVFDFVFVQKVGLLEIQ